MSDLSSVSLTLHGPLYSLNNKRAVFYSPKAGRVVNERQGKVREMMDRMAWEAKQGYRTECKKFKLPYHPLQGELLLVAHIFYRTAASDLDDSMLCNVLEQAGVIESDNQIRWKILSKAVDRKDPRVDVMLYI